VVLEKVQPRITLILTNFPKLVSVNSWN